MKTTAYILVLCSIPLLVFSISNNPQKSTSLSSNAAPPNIEGVCAPEERDRRCKMYNPEPSCVCYMDGSCIDTAADRCTDCSNKKIYSINAGACSSKQLSNPGDICQDEMRNVNCFAYNPELSCACYFNGTCATQMADQCSACRDPQLASISKGRCSGAETSSTLKCKKTALDKCVKRNGALIKCAGTYTDGCICYKNGTCIEGPVNNCIQCQLDDVYGVEEGSKCPCKEVMQPTCIKKKIDSCPVHKNPAAVKCTKELSQGCVCYKDGTCEEKMMNPCSDCLYGKDVVAAQKDTKCPCPGYQ